MPVTEIAWRVTSIYKRQSQDREFLAGIHGVKLSSGNSNIKKPSPEFTEEESDKLDIAMKKAIARKLNNGKEK